MKVETAFFKATDGVSLKGFIYKSEVETHKILISIHGVATNCPKERDEKIAEKVNELNIDLLSFNNRGHDIVNTIKKENFEREELAGTAFEEISECYEDILGALNYAIENNYSEIYLMGHSLGSTKTIYAYNKLLENNNKMIDNIKGIILLSLVDIPTAIKVYLQDNFPAMVTYAKNLKKENLEYELMPEKSFIHPISVKTFLRYSIDNKDIDFARFSDTTFEFEKINNIKVPLFMRWGNVNELILQNAEDLCNLIKEKIKIQKKDIDFIEGADHSYHGKEEVLANEIKEFLKNIK